MAALGLTRGDAEIVKPGVYDAKIDLQHVRQQYIACLSGCTKTIWMARVKWAGKSLGRRESGYRTERKGR